MFSNLAKFVTQWAGSSYASVASFLFIIGWVVGGFLWWGFGDSYQIIVNTVTTILTFLMVFLIQNTQNRESKAVQIKLDEVIFRLREADNRMIAIERLSEEELEVLSRRFQRIADAYRKAGS